MTAQAIDDLSGFLESVYTRLQPSQVFETTFDHKWQKTGAKWRGKCPWHESKSGTAFYLDTKTLTWRCPQCDRGGGAIQYLHQLGGGHGSPHGKAFLDIARKLGDLSGVEFPERELTLEQQELISKTENRRAMLETVISFCHRCLVDESKLAIAYLTKSRGFTLDDINALNFGVFPGAVRVAKVLADAGFAIADAVECGLLYETKSGEVGSTLEGYIIVPWNDEHGRLLTLYGRWHSQKPPEGRPKTTALRNPGTSEDPWLRSKRSPLYLDRAIAANQQDVIVVEGVLDAALLQARGDSRVIAWVAANPSGEQIATLKKCKVESVTFCLDPDGAGDKGTRQGVKRLTEAGIKTYAAPVLPNGLDPDEFVIQHGLDGWNEHLGKKLHGFRYEAQKIIADCQPLNDEKIQSAIEQGEEFAKCVPDALRTAFDTFFWQEFKTQAGLDIAAPKSASNEFRDAVSRFGAIKDPFDKILAENEIANQYKVRGDRLERLVQFQNAVPDSVVSIGDISCDLFTEIEDRSQGKIPPGISCGFYDLDAMTQGFQRGDLIVVAGRPSMGKTSFAMNIARSIAAFHKFPILIFSLEMQKSQLVQQLLASEVRIESGRIRSGRIYENEWEKLNHSISAISQLPIHIDDSPMISTSEMLEKAQELQANLGEPLGLILVDYLQLINGESGHNRVEELSKITRSLKAMARVLNVPVIALSQLSRSVEQRTNKRPMMSDLRESGGIEQDADLIMMIYRDEYYNPDSPDRGIAEVILTKHRCGPTGVVKLLFEPQFTQFRNLKS